MADRLFRESMPIDNFLKDLKKHFESIVLCLI
jgi:hypothetical protein